jgi:glycosyltransferase involved in cell wall biosynthesis
MDYCKVLIFGQTFNNKHGGGITLTNLFKGWPKEKIAVADTGHMMYDVTTDVCSTYYQLGIEEFRWRFPFALLQKKFPSGLKSFGEVTGESSEEENTGFRYALVNRIFYPSLHWLGMFHCVSKMRMSPRFKKWLSEFKPDVLYIQVTTRETLLFVSELLDYLRIPSAIHIMDDWPSTISKRGLLKAYWRKIIDKEFRTLLNKVNLHLSISDAMSDEYKDRYGMEFIAFHNPFDAELWLPYTKKDFAINKDDVKILISGRIGINGIAESLVEVASAIETMNTIGLTIRLYIQTPTKDNSILDQLKKFKCVVINPFADYSSIPGIFSNADILMLANDFNFQGINYLRFSMPTKASEYMISGTPVVVYSSGMAAVSRFFSQNECGYCVTKQSKEEIVKAILLLIENEDLRKDLSTKAVQVAQDRFDAANVRRQFKNLIVNLDKNR